MFDRFTESSRRIMGWARKGAQGAGLLKIGAPEILVGALREGTVSKILREMDVDLSALRMKAEAAFDKTPPKQSSLGQLPFTPEAKRVLEFSAALSVIFGTEITPELLFLGSLSVLGPSMEQLPTTTGTISRERVRRTITLTKLPINAALDRVGRYVMRKHLEGRDPELEIDEIVAVALLSDYFDVRPPNESYFALGVLMFEHWYGDTQNPKRLAILRKAVEILEASRTMLKSSGTALPGIARRIAQAREALELRPESAHSSHDFEVVFDPRMSRVQIQNVLSVLADFYRECGGAGLVVEFEEERARSGTGVRADV